MAGGGGLPGLSWDIPSNKRNIVTTTRTRDDIVTTLTNIDTKSEAWGKVIPMGFGRHRVAGALVWASPFYKTLESFDDLTTEQSVVTWQTIRTGSDAARYLGLDPNSEAGVFHPPVVNEPEDITTDEGSQVTHGTLEAAYIDLCYSFGTEGDTRKRRYIEKVRINDTIVYDTTQPYIADGIGFSVRYGYDNAAPSLLAKYPNGKFHYKGQTLICFDRFPLALFGNSVPQSVDVEWGCCQAQISTYNPRPCDFHLDVNNYGNVNPLYYGKGDLSFYTYQPGDLLIFYLRNKIGQNVLVDDSFSTIKGANQGIYAYTCGAKILNAAEALELQNGLRQLTNAKANIFLQSYSSHNGNPMPAGSVRQAVWTFVPKGQTFQHIIASADGYGINIKFGTDLQANDLDGIFIDDSHPCQVGQPVGFVSENDLAPDGGWMVFSAVIATPCATVG